MRSMLGMTYRRNSTSLPKSKKSVKSLTNINSSPRKKKEIDLDFFVDQNKRKRQQLNDTIDAYHLIFKTNAPFRCLQHNCVLSLYCETEQKLLCATCIYTGSSVHKHHRVFPIEKCYTQISRDIEQYSRQNNREEEEIINYQKYLSNVYAQQEIEANKIVLELIQKYEEIRLKLQQSFENMKKRVFLELEKIGINNDKMLIEVAHMKSLHKVNYIPPLEKMKGQSQLLYFHLVGRTMVESKKLDFERIKKDEGMMKKIKEIQLKKLDKIFQIVGENEQMTQMSRLSRSSSRR